MNKFLKVLLIMLCAVVLVVLSVAGTLAWLSARTQTVTNTFTAGDISITLVQNTVQTDAKIVPGQGYAVDPVVTVKAGSEDCWLFIKIDAPANFTTFFECPIITDWKALENTPGVYYQKVTDITSDKEFHIINRGIIAVNGEITKTQLNQLRDDTSNSTLGISFTAYAVQAVNFDTAAAAWDTAKNLPDPSETTTSGTPEQVEEEAPPLE